MARTLAKDHSEKRALILKRAAALFASEGFDRTSVSSVAVACEISKANIYHYYSSKDAILFDILDQYLSRLRDRICGLDLGGLEPTEQFKRTVVEVLLAYQGADDEHRLQLGAMTYLPETQRAILVDYQRDIVRHMGMLVKAVTPQVFHGNPSKLRATTMSLFGMLNWFYMWNRDADRQAREEYAALVCDLCLSGFKGL